MSRNQIKPNLSNYFKAALAALLIILSVVLYVFEFDHFDKTINIKYLLLLAVILGLLVGILISRRLAINEFELFEQMRIYMICTIICIVFMPLVLSLTNRLLDFRTPDLKTAQILSFQAVGDQPFGHIKGEKLKITNYEWGIELDQQVFNFRTKTLPFGEKKLGDNVQISVYQGLLGIRYLKF